MRFWIPFLALVFCGAAIAVEALPHSADTMVCRYGLCRFDEMYAAASAGSMESNEVAALLQQDPNNPNAWCTYAEFLALHDNSVSGANDAASAFERAMSLAPGVPAIAMRAANFYFTHDGQEEAFQLSAKILGETGIYDEVLFSYLRMAGVAASQLEGTAVPVDRRAAKSWLTWLIDQNAPQDDILSAYRWARASNIASEDSAPVIVNEFWKRHEYQTARTVWTKSQPAQPGVQILNNPKFQQAPSPVPFDWNLTPSSDVEIDRDANGLDVHFLGLENVDFRGVRQYAAVGPGRYRFSAEVSTEGLTTDRMPFFQIEDGESAARLSASSAPVLANVLHSTVTLDVLVPPQTRILSIQMVRLPSWKFDNKIEGHVRIHSVNLTPLF